MGHNALHGPEHISGDNAIPAAVSGGASGLLTGADKARVDDIENIADTRIGITQPVAHAAQHVTGGNDAIQSATNAQNGLATAAHITAIEANTAHAGNTSNPHSTTFLQLGDTPGSYNAGRILYESGAAVVDSDELTYAANTLKVENTAPSLALIDTDGNVDEKRFFARVEGGELRIIWENDAQTLTANPLAAYETGVTLSALTFQAGGATVNTILTSITASNTALVTSGAVDDALATKVTTVGTPVDNQVGVWTGDGTLEGDANLTFDGTTLSTDRLSVVFVSGDDTYTLTETKMEASGLGGVGRIETNGGTAGVDIYGGTTPDKLAEFAGTTSSVTINPGNADVDFFVGRNTSGNVIAFDAGTNVLTLSAGNFHVDDTTGVELIKANVNGTLFNGDQADRDFEVYRVTSGVAFGYYGNTDNMVINANQINISDAGGTAVSMTSGGAVFNPGHADKDFQVQTDTINEYAFSFDAGTNVTTIDVDTRFNDDVVLPKTSGFGIKVDTTTPTYTWRDITSDIVVKGGANSPTWTTFRTNISAYQFDVVNDEVWSVFHVPHDYVPGTEIYIHAHWGLDTANSTNSITWGFDATYAKVNYTTVKAFPATTNKTITHNCSTVNVPQYGHVVSEVQLTDGSGRLGGATVDQEIEPDGLILVRTYLSADAGNIDPFLFTVDLHYQSSNIGTKSKVPDFWT